VGKNKLAKFDAIGDMPNVFQNNGTYYPEVEFVGKNGKKVDYLGKWNELYFKNNNPIVLELACGAGEYTVGMAEIHPEKNFIGIDIKGNRLWNGANYALENNLNNVAFIRARIEMLDVFFDSQEVSEIWITFADPFPSDRRRKHRLTFTRFLQMYKKLLKPDGLIHLKTDSDLLYEFTLEMIEENEAKILYQNNDIYKNGYQEPLLDLKTKYEKMHLADGKTVKYVKFKF